MAEFLELESQDGVWMPWNVIPGMKQESSNCVVPVSTIYSSIRPLQNITILLYSLLCCRTCRSVLNPFAIVDSSPRSGSALPASSATTSLLTMPPSLMTTSPLSSSLITPPSSTPKTTKLTSRRRNRRLFSCSWSIPVSLRKIWGFRSLWFTS